MFLPLHYELPSLNLLCPLGSAFVSILVGEEVGEVE